MNGTCLKLYMTEDQKHDGKLLVEWLLERARQDLFLVVQLTDNREDRFPLPLREIEQSRRRARPNGEDPLQFDLIDTPQAAFHYYTPRRFTATQPAIPPPRAFFSCRSIVAWAPAA